MRFFQTISTLLLGAALSTSVLAAPTPASSDVQTRSEGIETFVERDGTIVIRADSCGGSNSKRDFSKRFDPLSQKVNQGEIKSFTDIALGLYTENLKPCIGVVVIGTTKKDSKSFRVLGHFQATKLFWDSEWDQFKKYVKDAELKDERGFISAPEVKEGSGIYKNKEDREAAEKYYKNLEDDLDGIIDGSPITFWRDVNVPTSMEVTGSNVVKINDQQVS